MAPSLVPVRGGNLRESGGMKYRVAIRGHRETGAVGWGYDISHSQKALGGAGAVGGGGEVASEGKAVVCIFPTWFHV